MLLNPRFTQSTWFAILWFLIGPSAHADDRRRDFAADPQWESFNSRQVTDPQIIRHDFGWSNTNRAGGAAPGELGGRFSRSISHHAHYGMKLDRIYTLDDRLEVGGRFAVTASTGASGILVGWFNDATPGWRTPNSINFRLDGGGSSYWIFYEWCTRLKAAGGAGAFEGRRYQDTPTKPFPADGAQHPFHFLYDPAANNGVGEMSFRVDDRQYHFPLTPDARAQGAEFNRFGFWNQAASGEALEASFDDLIVNGRTFSFDADPLWEAVNARLEAPERAVRPLQDFGFNPGTSHAGGEPGEIGGMMWCDPTPAYYADSVGPFSLDDPLRAAGRLTVRASGTDTGFAFGWFDSASKKSNDSSDEKSPYAPNILGIVVEGPSRLGNSARPFYRVASGDPVIPGADTGPVAHPDGIPREWSINYDPNAGVNRQGRITAVYQGREMILDLRAEDRAAGATLDRFGLFNMQVGGWYMEVYLDDVSYSAEKAGISPLNP